MTNRQQFHGCSFHIDRVLLMPLLALLAVTILVGLPAVTTASFTAPGSDADAAVTGYWSPVAAPTDRHLLSVDMVSSGGGWAVGDGGVILHWDGVVWEQVSSPTTACLGSVSVISSTAGSAVGSDDTILGWAGDQWQEIDGPTRDKGLSSVSMVSTTDVWAVGMHTGFSAFCSGGVILHWDGTGWHSLSVPYDLHSVAMVSPDDGWIGGSYYSEVSPAETILLHWNGVSWERDPSPSLETPVAVNSIALIAPDDGWAVGFGPGGPSDGVILHWDGESWTRLAGFAGSGLLGVDMISAVDGWAVGFNGSIVHWDGTSWEPVYSPTDRRLDSVSMVSANDGWIVGEGGTILHYWVPNDWSYLPVVERESDRTELL